MNIPNLNSIGRESVKKASFVIAILVCIGSSVLAKLIAIGFDLTYIASPQFWGALLTDNAPLVILAILVFEYKTLEHELSCEKLLSVQKDIDKLYDEICGQGAMLMLEKDIENINRERKLSSYRNALHYKMAKEKKSAKKDKYKELIRSAEADVEYVDVKFFKIRMEVLFAHVERLSEGNPFEGRKTAEAMKLILYKISSIVLFAIIMRSFIFNILEDISIVVIFSALISLFQVLLTYLFSSITARDYVYGKELSAYLSRYSYLMGFLDRVEAGKIRKRNHVNEDLTEI